MPGDLGIYSADQIGKLPEIGEDFTLLEIPKTPFTSMLRRGEKPANIQALYYARQLRRVKRTGRLEGKDIDTFKTRVRKELYSRGQLFGGDETSFKVTDLVEITKLAGGLVEYAQQKSDALVELKRQMESQFLSSSDSAAESGSTPNTTRGVFSWGSTSAQSHLPVDSDLRPHSEQSLSGTLNTTNWNEAKFLTAMRRCYLQRNEEVDLVGLCGAVFRDTLIDWVTHKTDVSGKTPVYTVGSSGERNGAQIFPVVDVLKCHHGTVMLKSTTELLKDADGEDTTSTHTSAAFIDPELWELAFYRDIYTLELPDLGGGPRGAHMAEAMLKCLHPQGQIYLNFQAA